MTKENRDKPIEFPSHSHEGKRPALLIPYTSNMDALRSVADLLTCGHDHIFIVNQETSNLEVSVLAETCIIQGRLKENHLIESLKKFGRAGIINPNEGTVTIKLLHNHPSVDPCDEKCPLFRIKMDAEPRLNPVTEQVPKHLHRPEEECDANCPLYTSSFPERVRARGSYGQPPVPDQPRLRHNHGFSDECDSRCPVFRAVTLAEELDEIKKIDGVNDPIPSPFDDEIDPVSRPKSDDDYLDDEAVSSPLANHEAEKAMRFAEHYGPITPLPHTQPDTLHIEYPGGSIDIKWGSNA